VLRIYAEAKSEANVRQLLKLGESRLCANLGKP